MILAPFLLKPIMKNDRVQQLEQFFHNYTILFNTGVQGDLHGGMQPGYRKRQA